MSASTHLIPPTVKQRLRALKLALLAAALALPLAVTAATHAALPNLGDPGDMSLSAERALGDRIAREIYRDPDYIDDPLLAEYAQSIWHPLLAAARLRGEISAEMDERLALEVLLVRDRSVNAFALPGGYMGVHLGMIGIVANRDELASVLGHELSHITQRHISRVVAKQNQQTPWLLGAMILGVLAASKSPDAASALLTGGQALAIQNQLNFSRDMEREADRVGFGVMSQAGFEPQAFASMFDKLQQSTRLSDSGAYPYLRTHPLTTERIGDVQARLPHGAAGAALLSAGLTPSHAMIAARARVLANPSTDALRLWQDEAQALTFEGLEPTRKMAALTSAILANIKLRDFARAGPLLARLQPLAAGDAGAGRLARLLAAELALAQDDGTAAMALLGEGTTTERPELLLQAQAQVRTGRAKLAAQSLQTWVVAHPRDASAWMLLASAYNALGQTVGAVRAEAEAQVAQLDYPGAIARFKAAQARIKGDGAGRSAGDHIEASIIDTRTREVELLLREQVPER
ncbi:MAG: M48 family metalloprotease [Betaproteobacteria bacterium]